MDKWNLISVNKIFANHHHHQQHQHPPAVAWPAVLTK